MEPFDLETLNAFAKALLAFEFNYFQAPEVDRPALFKIDSASTQIASNGLVRKTITLSMQLRPIKPLTLADENSLIYQDYFFAPNPSFFLWDVPGAYEWSIPQGWNIFQVIACSGGGGGGSGRRGSYGTVSAGGAGASSGAFISTSFEVSSFSSDQLNLVVGSGGAGGSARLSDDTDGMPGTNGGDTVIETTARVLSMLPGGVGGTGGTAVQEGSTTRPTQEGILMDASDGGRASSSYNGSGDGTSGNRQPGGGGGGGSIDAGYEDIRFAGSGGIGNKSFSPFKNSLPRVYQGQGGAGEQVSTISKIDPGSGGGGGGAGKHSAAGNGGEGCRGGGGGGGGGSRNGHPSGAGGKGGNGFIAIIRLE